jgi:isopentenyl-diphosphate Delta-isomerase
VVLVDEADQVLGAMDKLLAHNEHTPLHRGVSAFLFNNQSKVLIQKRSYKKITWPGFWSNSFCGHPQAGETYEQAIVRHAKFELGIDIMHSPSSLRATTWERGNPALGIKEVDCRVGMQQLSNDATSSIYFATQYRYKFSYNNICENEICPIYLVLSDEKINANPDEVVDYKWLTWYELLNEIQNNLDAFTPWCKEEVLMLNNSIL